MAISVGEVFGGLAKGSTDAIDEERKKGHERDLQQRQLDAVATQQATRQKFMRGMADKQQTATLERLRAQQAFESEEAAKQRTFLTEMEDMRARITQAQMKLDHDLKMARTGYESVLRINEMGEQFNLSNEQMRTAHELTLDQLKHEVENQMDLLFAKGGIDSQLQQEAGLIQEQLARVNHMFATEMANFQHVLGFETRDHISRLAREETRAAVHEQVLAYAKQKGIDLEHAVSMEEAMMPFLERKVEMDMLAKTFLIAREHESQMGLTTHAAQLQEKRDRLLASLQEDRDKLLSNIKFSQMDHQHFLNMDVAAFQAQTSKELALIDADARKSAEIAKLEVAHRLAEDAKDEDFERNLRVMLPNIVNERMAALESVAPGFIQNSFENNPVAARQFIQKALEAELGLPDRAADDRTHVTNSIIDTLENLDRGTSDSRDTANIVSELNRGRTELINTWGQSGDIHYEDMKKIDALSMDKLGITLFGTTETANIMELRRVAELEQHMDEYRKLDMEVTKLQKMGTGEWSYEQEASLGGRGGGLMSKALWSEDARQEAILEKLSVLQALGNTIRQHGGTPPTTSASFQPTERRSFWEKYIR